MCLPVKWECHRWEEGEWEKVKEKKEIIEMHEIGTDSRRKDFTDNIQLIQSNM